MNRRWVAWSLVSLACGALAIYLALPYFLRTGDHELPINAIVADETLAISGQPSPTQLRQLRARGYTTVINLAPPDSFGAVTDEPDLVRAAGMTYHNIPVSWTEPRAQDFSQFQRILAQHASERVWVHCQLGYRASVFVSLYRVIDKRVPLQEAIQDVHAIWVPNVTWAHFMGEELKRVGVPYAPDDLR